MSSLSPEDFTKDEAVRIGCRDQEARVSERLVFRLVLIGAAYELHLLPLLREDLSISSVQAGALAAELEFVRSVVNDDALGGAVDRVTSILTLAHRSRDEITFEWP